MTLPQTPYSAGDGIPLPDPTLLSAYGASILVPPSKPGAPPLF